MIDGVLTMLMKFYEKNIISLPFSLVASLEGVYDVPESFVVFAARLTVFISRQTPTAFITTPSILVSQWFSHHLTFPAVIYACNMLPDRLKFML